MNNLDVDKNRNRHMVIRHLTESISTAGGGISIALKGLTAGLDGVGLRQEVLSYLDQGEGLGTWTSLSIVASQSPGPRIVSPHGMLDQWALGRSGWKKRVARVLFEQRHLAGAACLHALCRSEARSIRSYRLKNPVAIIPNGVDLPELSAGTENGLPETEQKILLFLGRLHPKKGLMNALRAWALAGRQGDGWQFVIAGWDQGGHDEELKRLCDELGLAYSNTPTCEFLDQAATSSHESSVVFVGPAFGEHKDRLLRHASAFILPSFSEGLPMSVLEAWSYRLPVLMTDHCNLPEGFANDAALRIGTETGEGSQGAGEGDKAMSIEQGLQILFEMSESDRKQMGLKGRCLVEERFTWPQVASQMKEVYEWILGGGLRPGCVE